MLAELIKTLHLIIGTTVFGLTIASYFYCIINLKNDSFEKFVLQKSIMLDVVIILPLIILSFITGSILVPLFHLSYSILWIKAAYLALTIIFVFQIFLLLFKLCRLKSTDNPAVPSSSRLLRRKLLAMTKSSFYIHFAYWIIFLGYIMIIHDAILRRTFLL